MKIGILKIEFVRASACSDWSYLPTDSPLVLANFISEALTEIPFTPLTGNFSSESEISSAGIIYHEEATASIRKQRGSYRAMLNALVRNKSIFVLTLADSTKIVIGSVDFPPTFSFSEEISGRSTSEFVISITNTSPMGIYTVSSQV